MRNVNRLLENSQRSDVRGYNVYSMGRYRVSEDDYRRVTLKKWNDPAPGLFGAVAIGYEIDTPDPVTPRVMCNGSVLSFSAVRHRWTPAYCDTYYRCEPIGDYRPAGTLVMRERKCFTEDDTFVSHLEFINDDSTPLSLEISLSVPFERVAEGIYRVFADVVVGGLKQKPKLFGYAAARTNRGEAAHIDIPPQGRAVLSYGFAFSKASSEAAEACLTLALSACDPFADAEARFNLWMQRNAPRIETENTDILKVYYYRFFLMKCAIHTPSDVIGDAVFPRIAVYESPFGSWFGCPIGLPIPLQLEEMRWMRSDDAARDQIDAWCAALGNTQNYIQYTPMAILRFYRQRGDIAMLRAAYPACRAFTLEKSGKGAPECLPATRGSWQTGAEYQPSFYQYTDPAWDWRFDQEGIRLGLADSARDLYRVDACTMHVANLIACGDIATILGKTEEAAYFSETAKKAREALTDVLYSVEDRCFYDRDIVTGKLCDKAENYAGFFPFLFDIAEKERVGAFDRLEGDRFSCGFSTTTTAKDCPMYWLDSRIVCGGGATKSDPHHYFSSWNGAIWPFASSLVLDALGGVAAENEKYQTLFLRLFGEYTDLHFVGGDRSLPCIVEHYRVSDGYPLSPYTEYFHSKWIDLLLSYWAGIRLDGDGVSFLPMTEEDFAIDGVVINGADYRFEQRAGKRYVSCTPMQADCE